MKRLLGLLALASVMACGDDDDVGAPAPDAGKEDASTPVRDMDAGGTQLRVNNAGAACEADRACQGELASCASATLQNVPFPGGYCTASCLSADVCGANGDCPFGELVTALGVGHVALGGLTAGQCLQRCTELGQRSTCREGYVCSNLASTSPLAVALPAWQRPVCLPIGVPVDAGVSDAGDAGDASTTAIDPLDASL